MSDTTTIRVSSVTRAALRELAQRRGETVTSTVERAVRLLEQEMIGVELSVPLGNDEIAWLDADGG